jgi:chitinase
MDFTKVQRGEISSFSLLSRATRISSLMHRPSALVHLVNFAFFQTDTSGAIWGTDSWADPIVLFGPYNWNPTEGSKERCSWDGPSTKSCNTHDDEKGLIHLVKSAGAEIYPSLGGWTLSDAFPAMAAVASARATFAQNCIDLIVEYDFDGRPGFRRCLLLLLCLTSLHSSPCPPFPKGIDIDWEYPGYVDHSGTPQDRDNFKLLLNDVRSKLDELGAQTGKFYGLTAALPCGPDHISNMDIAHVASTLSQLNLMTYGEFLQLLLR